MKRRKEKKLKRKLEIDESQKNTLNKFLGSTTSVLLSSTSDNPQCISKSNIFPEASSEVRPFIPPDSVQNKGDDSEKWYNEEVQSNNESNRDMKSEEDKDRPERFIDLDVEMLNDIALWPTTLTDLLIEITSNIIRKKPNNIDTIETLKSVYIDRDSVSSMREDKLNSIAILYKEQDVLDQIDTAKVIDEFGQEKSRRKVI
ncbi:hypothetical protein NPIL_300031 [Nephila pilipes]|uniref:Uncharacterized protein n=1 Tax=Nephila pilipes TaxID=299642 RepID=A0A8X6NV44_NEPPI|nr:hypothetical protein NPIL_300031 [Nephila pilipes]